MKNNLIKAIFVSLYIVIIITAYNINVSYAQKNGFSRNSKYIWIDEENSSNSWVCFRKKIEIKEKNLDSYIARIAVDSKYWLYINGNIIIREGGLKRSQKNSIYYDEIELKDFLIEGENTIGILVWHFGKLGFSHIDSSLGSLLFYMDIGEEEIVSNNSWKGAKNIAYKQDEKKVPPRLSESNIYYDANLELRDWFESSFDDTMWENVKIIGSPNDMPWGRLIKRDIPMFVFDENIKEYENISEFKNMEFNENKEIEMKLNTNIQFTPYLKVDSIQGKEIRIYSKNEDNPDVHEVTYITKDGIQEFESLAWISGDKVYYYIPEGVKILSLGYRKTGYNSEVVSSFECDDEFLNKLWDMSVNTLLVNMRDSFMDCPDRERTMWIADTSLAMEEAVYSLDYNSLDLYKKAIKNYISWRDGKALMSVIPSYVSNLQLPIQNLIWIDEAYNYYLYTGDKEFLEVVYPYFKEYLKLWSIQEDGMTKGIGDYYKNLWPWYDTVGKTDEVLLENSLYYYANTKMLNIAKVLGKKYDEKIYLSRLEKLENGIKNSFYIEGQGYKSKDFEGFDGRANAVLVLSGIANESQYESIKNVLVNQDGNTPFWEKYILEALCNMNMYEEAVNRIKTKYGEMVELKEEYSSTLWEYFEKDKGSKNHTWSAGPMIIMQKYIAGISPADAGFEKVKIEPNLGSLKNIKSTVNTAKGIVNLEINKGENNIIIKIETSTDISLKLHKETENYIVFLNNEKCIENSEIIENRLIKNVEETDSYIEYDMKNQTNVLTNCRNDV